jgi:hypothetical protein
LLPAVGLNVPVALAWPVTSVVLVAGIDPPEPVLHVTVTPPTGLPPASVTRTTNGAANAVPTVPLCPLPETATTVAAAPATPVAVKLTGVRPVTVAVYVLLPAVGLSVPVALAVPSAAVVLVAGIDPPEPVLQLTVTPPTGLLVASSTRTTNGAANAVPTGPLCPLPETATTVTGAPATPVAVKLTGVSPVTVAV